MKKLLLVITTILWAVSAHAASWYVDGSVSTSGNGHSWATAWKNISNITGVSAGDTVYISGGPSGSTQTYTMSDSWAPIGGTAGNPVTYKIGRDSQHNGTAFFSGTGRWLSPTPSNYVISGDAGDGLKHFTTADPSTGISAYSYLYETYNSSTRSNIRLSYINFGQISPPKSGSTRMRALHFSGCSGIEIDHTYTYVTGSNPDSWLTLDTAGSAYDVNSVHHNEVRVVNHVSGLGPDHIKGGAATSIYNNTFTGVPSDSFAGTQHNDGIQTLGGNYIKIYNNKFVNISSYPVYFLAQYADFYHCQIYNNEVVITDSRILSYGSKGMQFGQHQGAMKTLGRSGIYDDVIVANNTTADYVGKNCIGMGGQDVSRATYHSNTIMANNICWKGAGYNYDSNVTVYDNVVSSTGTHFVSYTQFSSSNDFHLLSSDTTFKEQGTSMASYFTTDKDGVSRPQGSAWDMGAYEYVGPAPRK